MPPAGTARPTAAGVSHDEVFDPCEFQTPLRPRDDFVDRKGQVLESVANLFEDSRTGASELVERVLEQHPCFHRLLANRRLAHVDAVDGDSSGQVPVEKFGM